MTRKLRELNADALGMGVSFLCAAHCMLIPALMAASAYGGMVWLENHTLELVFIIASVAIASWSLIQSYLNRHRKITPLLVVLAGFLLIIIGQQFNSGAQEHLITGIGGLVIAVAHFLNWKLLSRQEGYTEVISPVKKAA